MTRKWDWCPIKVVSKRDTGQLEECRRDINMGCDRILHLAFWDSRAADVEWNPDIFVESCRLPRRQPMLTDMEPIVGRIEDVGVIELTTLFQTCY